MYMYLHMCVCVNVCVCKSIDVHIYEGIYVYTYVQMGYVEKVLRFHWRLRFVDIKVDTDKTSLLDVVEE